MESNEQTQQPEGEEKSLPAGQEGTPQRRPKSKRAIVHSVLFAWLLPVLTSGIVRALGIYIFVTPNNFAPGGINGISVLLEYGTHINAGWFLLIFNVPLFFVAFFTLGKRQAVVATTSMLLTSGLLIVLGQWNFLPVFNGFSTEEPIAYGLLAAVAGGIFLGVALAIMLRSCGTAGGTSILASVVNKKWRNLSVSWLTFGFDAVVVLASFFVYYSGENSFAVNLVPVLLALVSLFVTSKACDVIVDGFRSAYKFEIITDHPEEIAFEIMNTTHHGVTMMHATGMYSHEDKSYLVCIIRKRHIATVQRIIKTYPGTFASFSPTSEVYGKFLK